MSFSPPSLPDHVHFIGICGKGMMGLASVLQRLSIRVTGSDEESFAGAEEWLRERDIPVQRGFAASNLDDRPDLVVICRAYGRGNPEVEAVLDRGLRYTSLPRFIADYFLDGSRNLVIAGSKGKTTTTAMSTWIMEQAGLAPGYLVAGPMLDLPEPARFGGQRAFHVLEGDDYTSLWCDHNPKFCYYRPEAAVLTNIYADHPEVHPDPKSATRHFGLLVSQIPRHGLLVVGDDGPLTRAVREGARCRVVRTGFDAAADHPVREWRQDEHGIDFELEGVEFRLPLFGRLNALNASAAALAVRHFGVPLETSAAALRRFHGVHDRMERIASGRDFVCYTDMSYLPESMEPVFEALRLRHPGHRLVFLFQPHVIEGLPQSHALFLRALAQCDLVLMADVYRPKSYQLTNPGFSDDVVRHLNAAGVSAARVGPIDEVAETAPPHLRPGDVVLGVTHPKRASHFFRLAQKLTGEDACAS